MLLSALTSCQISEWEAYNEIDPIGSWRDDYRTALICSTIVNIVRSLFSKLDKKDLATIQEFMPDWTPQEDKENLEKQPIEDMKKILFSIAKSKKR